MRIVFGIAIFMRPARFLIALMASLSDRARMWAGDRVHSVVAAVIIGR